MSVVLTESDLAAMWDAGIIGQHTDEFIARLILWPAVRNDVVVFERSWKKARPYTVPGCPALKIPDGIGNAPPDGTVGKVIDEMTADERAALRDRVLNNPKVVSWMA